VPRRGHGPCAAARPARRRGRGRAFDLALAAALERFEAVVGRLRVARERRVQAAQRGAEARRLAPIQRAADA
jgi:hypothetical protein